MIKRNIILVTGGAGYVGTILVKELIKKGFKVRVFDRLYFGEKPLYGLKNKIDLIEGDIRKLPNYIFDNVKTVIHLAALSNDPTAEFNPKANFEINTKATISLAEKAKKSGVERFIFGSSASIYDLGIAEGLEIKTERSRVAPKHAYALSKLKAERGILKLASDKFVVVVFRKGTIFGFSPRMRYDLVVNAMIKNSLQCNEIKIFNRGIQWRPLISIQDVVNVYMQAISLSAKKINKQIFNISLGNFLVIDLAILVKNVLEKNFNKKIAIVYDEGDKNDRSYSISGEKAKKILGFTPTVTIEQAIVEIVKKIQKNHYTDFANSIYYNIFHMKSILEKE